MSHPGDYLSNPFSEKTKRGAAAGAVAGAAVGVLSGGHVVRDTVVGGLAGGAAGHLMKNPLKRGCSRESISHNISLMMHEGKSQAQSVAIALSYARKQKCKGVKASPNRSANPTYPKNTLGTAWNFDEVALTNGTPAYGVEVYTDDHPHKAVRYRIALDDARHPERGWRLDYWDFMWVALNNTHYASAEAAARDLVSGNARWKSLRGNPVDYALGGR